jgi:hypothetical protein
MLLLLRNKSILIKSNIVYTGGSRLEPKCRFLPICENEFGENLRENEKTKFPFQA